MAKKDKSRQKKFDTRIDFTPMVDMNMLLITFFMLCTTMLKSQTQVVTLPTNDKLNQDQQDKAKVDDAITFIIDGTVTTENGIEESKEGVIYWYEGKPNIDDPDALKEIKFGNAKDEIRGILQKRNAEMIAKAAAHKKDWENGLIDDTTYNARVEADKQAIKNDRSKNFPNVQIKLTDNASYSDLVRMLDEMDVNKIILQRIAKLDKNDSILYERKFSRPIGSK